MCERFLIVCWTKTHSKDPSLQKRQLKSYLVKLPTKSIMRSLNKRLRTTREIIRVFGVQHTNPRGDRQTNKERPLPSKSSSPSRNKVRWKSRKVTNSLFLTSKSQSSSRWHKRSSGSKRQIWVACKPLLNSKLVCLKKYTFLAKGSEMSKLRS